MVLNIERGQLLMKALIKAVRNSSGPKGCLNRSILAARIDGRTEVVSLGNSCRPAGRLDAEGKQHHIGVILAAGAEVQVPLLGSLGNCSPLLQNRASGFRQF